MPSIRSRRVLAGLAAAAAACVFATPASAAPAVTVAVAIPPVTVAAGGNTLVEPILFASRETSFVNATMTFELSGGLTGVTLHNQPDAGPDCTEVSPTKLTCPTYSPVDLGPYGIVGVFPARVDATQAALGETGKLTATFSADGFAPVAQTADVTVAEGVDLAAGENKEISVKPGGKFDASLQVHNTTGEVVHGTAVIFGTDYAFAAPKQFSNCFYAGDQLNACTFDQELQPGVTYQVVVPYWMRPDTYAPSHQAGDFEWLTAGDYDDLIGFLDGLGYEGPGKAGSGDKLSLEALPSKSALARPKQTDPNPENNWQNLTVNVTGKQGTDLAAIGATVSGAVGDTVTATVGVRNNGPATVDRSRVGDAAAMAVITIPDGTKVTGAPDDCVKSDDGSLKTPKGKGKVQYACFSDFVFPAKTTVTWPFRLKITNVTANATGWVEINPNCACDRFARDLDKSNDVAKIVVNPAAGGDTGGQGGGLPITGPQTALFAAAGLVLIIAGAGGVLLARRRRTRFQV